MVPIKLERRSKGAISVDFHVKKMIASVMPKVKDREDEWVLANDKVEAVIDLLSNGGRSFETTPKVYSRMEEEELRDILLGWLNAVFEGEATGETFSKMGKTDIHLKLTKGDILIVECKIWKGEKYLNEGVDQLFQYLTWRENFGVCIVFCKLRSFGEIVETAKDAVREHRSYVSGSLEERGTTHFLASHIFPDDEKKNVKVHYLLFNLYYGPEKS